MKKDIKEKILNSAEELISSLGYRKTALIDIAKKAGISKSAMYYYFDSKAEILLEVIKKDLQAFKMKLEPIINETSSPSEKLEKFIITKVSHLSLLKNSYTTIVDEYLENYRFIEKALEDFSNYEKYLIQKILDEGVKKGEFEINEKFDPARTIHLALIGLEKTLFIDNHHGIEEVSRNFAQLIIKGIKK